jgi:hypothetical protein
MSWDNNDYFATQAELAGLIGTGSTTNSTDISEAEWNYILPQIEGYVHDWLKIHRITTTVPFVSTTTGYYIVKNAILGLCCMYIQRREYMKRTNRIENAQFYINFQPTLTKKIEQDLQDILQFIADSTERNDLL